MRRRLESFLVSATVLVLDPQVTRPVGSRLEDDGVLGIYSGASAKILYPRSHRLPHSPPHPAVSDRALNLSWGEAFQREHDGHTPGSSARLGNMAALGSR